MLTKVVLKAVGHISRLRRQPHVSIGSHQIDGVARQTCLLHASFPRKDVQWEVMRLAPVSEGGAGTAVNMDLPAHGSDGLEVVPAALERDPRQAVSAMDAPGTPLIEVALA